MRIETEEHGAHVVIRPKGTFALGEATQALAETLTRAETEKSGAILVDLTDLRALDSTALGLLVGCLRRMHALSREVILVHPNERVRLLLSMTRLGLFGGHAFRVFSSQFSVISFGPRHRKALLN